MYMYTHAARTDMLFSRYISAGTIFTTTLYMYNRILCQPTDVWDAKTYLEIAEEMEEFLYNMEKQSST